MDGNNHLFDGLDNFTIRSRISNYVYLNYIELKIHLNYLT